MELREWLGVLGVAPAIPEAPDPLTGLSITFVPAEGPPMPGGIGASSSLTHEPPEYPDAPDPAEMLRELQDAVVGYRYASPNPPATEWRLLLAAVATHCAPHRNAASLPTHEQEQADA